MQGQVARAVTAHPLVSVESWRELFAQVAQHHLHLKAAAAEDDGLDAGADPGCRDASRLEHRAATHAQLAIQQRRVVEDQTPFTARRSAAVDEVDGGFLEQPLRELTWV